MMSQSNQTPEIKALQELRAKAKDLIYQYHIMEVVPGEKGFDREYGEYYENDYRLRNGMEIEESIYQVVVNKAIRYFLMELYNKGFEDSHGVRWKVDNLDLENYQLTDFQISEHFPGTTPFHHFLEKIKAHPDVPFYLPHELDLYPHLDEEDFLGRIKPQMKEHYLEIKGKLDQI